jgi:hypothetical protein
LRCHGKGAEEEGFRESVAQVGGAEEAVAGDLLGMLEEREGKGLRIMGGKRLKGPILWEMETGRYEIGENFSDGTINW